MAHETIFYLLNKEDMMWALTVSSFTGVASFNSAKIMKNQGLLRSFSLKKSLYIDER